MRRTFVQPFALGGALLVAVTAGCSYVGRDEYDTHVADMQATLEDHDSRISQNAGAVAELRTDVDALRRDLQQLRSDFQVRITELEDGLRFATPVHFEFDKADVREVDRPLLDRFARVVKAHYPGSMVTVEGFADPAGPAAYNERLSKKRADAVAAYLTGSAGLDAGMVRTVGYGEASNRLVAPGERGPGMTGIENRRVTFVVERTGGMGTS